MATIRNLLLRLGVDVDPVDKGFAKAAKAVDRFDKVFSKVMKGGAAGAVLGSTAGAATALSAALAPAAGALIALPGAMAASRVAAGTLKVGLMGVSEAMSAVAEGDAKKLNEALKNLSPNAREFVKASGGFLKSFDPVRRAVQDKLFQGLAGQMKGISGNLMPSIKTGMVGVAGAMNGAAREAGKFAQTDLAKGAVEKIFGATTKIIKTLAPAVQPALQAITKLTLAGLPLAQRMAEWGANGIKAAAAFLNTESGAARLSNWAKRAGDTLEQMGRIGKNAISGLLSVFGAAKTSGDGVLTTLEKMTAKFATWTASVGGQERLREGFQLLLEILRAVVQVLPLFLGPLGAVMKILTSMSPEVRGVVTQFLAFSLVGVLLAGKLSGLLGVVKGLTVGVVGAGGALIKFGAGLVQGSAGLAANAGAAAKAGAAVRTFGGFISSGISATASMVVNLSSMAGAYLKTGLAAAGAAAKTLIFEAASKVVALGTKLWAAAQWLLNAAMKANPIGIIITIIGALIAIVVTAYQKNETFRKIVQAVWKGIQAAISFAWNNIIKPAFKAIYDFIVNTLGPKFLWFHYNIVKPVMDKIGSVVRTVIAGVKSHFEFMAKLIMVTVPNAFKSGVAAIGRFWDKVKAIAKAPVTFMVNTIYNNGIRKIWNWVADKVGMGQLPEIKGFARGGILPGGYSRKDNQIIAARSGEGILVPEAVQGLGGPKFIYGVNSLARMGGAKAVSAKLGIPGFQDGGVVGWVSGFFSKAKEFFVNGFIKAAKGALNPIVELSKRHMGGTGFGGMLAGAVQTIVNGVLNKFKPYEDELGGGSATGVVKAAAKYIGQGDRGGYDNNDNQFNRNWGFGIGTPWCANFVSTAIRDAKAGKGYPGYPSAAVYGYWSKMNKVGVGSARPGDLGVYSGPTGHINIVEKSLGGGRFQTIGGNEGPLVRRAQRNSAYAMLRPKGYARGGIVDPRIYRERNEDPRDRSDPWRKLMARQSAPWATMDDGGVIRPGWNPPIWNGTGKTEGVFTADMIKAMGSRGGNTYHIEVKVAPGTPPAETGRQIVGFIREYERTNGTSWRGFK